MGGGLLDLRSLTKIGRLKEVENLEKTPLIA
jgi:hypothetical protein